MKLYLSDADVDRMYTGWGYYEWKMLAEDFPDVSWREKYPEELSSNPDAHFKVNCSGQLMRTTFYSMYQWNKMPEYIEIDETKMFQPDPYEYNGPYDIEHDYHDHPHIDKDCIVLRNDQNQVSVISPHIAKNIYHKVAAKIKADERAQRE